MTKSMKQQPVMPFDNVGFLGIMGNHVLVPGIKVELAGLLLYLGDTKGGLARGNDHKNTCVGSLDVDILQFIQAVFPDNVFVFKLVIFGRSCSGFGIVGCCRPLLLGWWWWLIHGGCSTVKQENSKKCNCSRKGAVDGGPSAAASCDR